MEEIKDIDKYPRWSDLVIFLNLYVENGIVSHSFKNKTEHINDGI